jgi:DNA-binding NarL/FixJ family response regulator
MPDAYAERHSVAEPDRDRLQFVHGPGWELEPPVPVYVAVIDPLPIFRHGIGTILSANGYTVESPHDVAVWARGRQDCLVLLSLCAERDWDLLAQLCAGKGDLMVIALVEDGSEVLGAQAVRIGARSVLAREATVCSLERAVAATVEGEAVMPTGVARVLADGASPAPAPAPALSAEHLSWLRRLAAGSTVAQLASEAGYSERAMFRLLQAIYRKLGARSRLEAILRAQELGWLRGGPTHW